MSCWRGSIVLDYRLPLGERSVTCTITGGGRTQTLSGRLRVEPAAAADDHDGIPDL